MALKDSIPSPLRAKLDARTTHGTARDKLEAARKRIGLVQQRSRRAMRHNNHVRGVNAKQAWGIERKRREYYDQDEAKKPTPLRDHDTNRRRVEMARDLKLLRHNNSVLETRQRASWAHRRQTAETASRLQRQVNTQAEKKQELARRFNQQVDLVREKRNKTDQNKHDSLVANVMALSDFLPHESKQKLNQRHSKRQAPRGAALGRRLRASLKRASARRRAALLRRAATATRHINKVKSTCAQSVWKNRRAMSAATTAMAMRMTLADLSRKNALIKSALKARLHNNTHVAEVQLTKASEELQHLRSLQNKQQQRDERGDLSVQGKQCCGDSAADNVSMALLAQALELARETNLEQQQQQE